MLHRPPAPSLPFPLSPFLLILALLLTPGLTHAQDAPEGADPGDAEQDTSDIAMYVRMPDSVVVTASRVAEAQRFTGRRVNVWTRKDIAQLPVTTVDQLLQVTAGLDVKSRGAFGVQSDLSLRGSTFNGVLLLVDGARVNDPMTGHFLMDLPIPLAEIQRVEVLRGPATALYGPDALGGVVQIFTRTALASTEGTENGWGADLNGQFGDYALYDAGGQVRHARGHGRYSVAVTAQGTDGEPILDESGTPIQSSRGEVRTDFERYAGTAAFKTKLGDGSIFARVGVDDRDFNAFHYYQTAAADTAREATQTLWAQVRATGTLPTDTRWYVQLAGKQHGDEYTYYPGLTPSQHTSRLGTVQAKLAHDVSDALTVTGGASGQLRGIDSNTLGLRFDQAGGVFTSAKYQPAARWTINGSLRLDADAVYGLEPTPQLFVSYALDRVTLRAGGGRAVRTPNYIERFVSVGTNRGTPDLDAERSWSGEAGADLYLTPGLTLHVTGFARRTKDLIDYARFSESDDLYVAQNLNEVETLGLETEAQVQRRVRSARVRLKGAYTLMEQTLDTQEPVFEAKYALTSPRHLLQGNASVAWRQITASVNASYTDRLGTSGPATDRYGLIHARLAYGWQLTDDTHVALSAEARNLLDEDYTVVLDAPMPGRTFLASVRVWL